MSNLYKILFSHTAPKDSKTGIVSYVNADNDEHVYSLIDEKHGYGCWKDSEEENNRFDIYDDDYNITGTESFKEKIIRIKGEMNDEDYDYSDAYYGITLYGWELVKEGVGEADLSILAGLNIID